MFAAELCLLYEKFVIYTLSIRPLGPVENGGARRRQRISNKNRQFKLTASAFQREMSLANIPTDGESIMPLVDNMRCWPNAMCRSLRV